MFHSFRLKIGLLSLCLSGLLLSGFGIFASSVLNRVGLKRIDRELRALADHQVRRSQPSGHWQRFDDSLRSIYGDNAAKQFIVKVTHVNGVELFASKGSELLLPAGSLPLSLEGVPQLVPDSPPGKGGKRKRDRAALEGELAKESGTRPPPKQMGVRGPVYRTLVGGEGEWRAMTLANSEVKLTVAMDLAGLNAEIYHFRRALIIIAPLVLLLLAAGGWLIGHVALRPVNLIARTAESVTAKRLDERISNRSIDQEFQHLTDVINGMLERLERGFCRQPASVRMRPMNSKHHWLFFRLRLNGVCNGLLMEVMNSLNMRSSWMNCNGLSQYCVSCCCCRVLMRGSCRLRWKR